MKLIRSISRRDIKLAVGVALICSTVAPLHARQLSADEAVERIKQIDNKMPARLGAPSAKAVKYVLRQTVPAADANAYYVFERRVAERTEGFTLATADTRLRPVLARFDNPTFDLDNLPENVGWWLGEYQRQIDAILSTPEPKDTETGATPFEARAEIEPLVTTRWDQGAPYNDLCPDVNGGRAVTGCVATAFAQVMNYHRWPERGQGSYSYTVGGNTYSIDFSEIEFDWDSMLDTYDDQSSEQSRTAVATLMKACGYAVDMDYSPWASGAVTNLIGSRAPQFFDYSTDC